MNEDDWDESVDEFETSKSYLLRGRDRSLVAAAIDLLDKIARANFIRPAELVSVAKALHLLKRLPQVTDVDIAIRVSLTGPRRCFGDHEIYHYWTVESRGLSIHIYSGGHFYRQSTGGDSFTSFQWDAVPGEEPDYANHLDQLHIVDDARPFPLEVEALDLSEPGFTLEVEDQDNPLLEEMDLPFESDESADLLARADHATTDAKQAVAGFADQDEDSPIELDGTHPPSQTGDMTKPEVILNLWYVHDNAGVIYSLRVRAYVRDGTDEEKMESLREAALTDYVTADQFPIPARLQTMVDGQSMPISHKSFLPTLGPLELFEEAIREIEADLTTGTDLRIGEAPLCCVTPLLAEDDGSVRPYFSGSVKF